MALVLGIDTGGTFTDGVLIDYESREIRATAKVPTTPEDLSLGIAACLDKLPGSYLEEVKLMALSTTLATNALVEEKGGRVCLLLVGYDRRLLERYGFLEGLSGFDLFFLKGRHDLQGEEVEPLDLEEGERIVRKMRDKVEAFAVSSYLGVRNPQHELQLQSLIRRLTTRPVVCAHQLTGELDSVRRAITAGLNARLIPLLGSLVRSVSAVLRQRGISAPLLMVRGDGSLVSASLAEERPVETILSGPAASVAGARHLSALEEAVVVDMGGTTTDVALLVGGRPVLNSSGPRVGSRPLCVRGIDITTIGLGGDSRIFRGKDGQLKVGPRRVIPLGQLALAHPEVLPELRRIASLPAVDPSLPRAEFFLARGAPPRSALEGGKERDILRLLQGGPLSLLQLSSALGLPYPSLLRLGELEDRGIVQRCGLTPTDVLQAQGEVEIGEPEASRWGLRIVAASLRVSDRELACLVRDQITRSLAFQVLEKAMTFDRVPGPISLPGCRACSHLLDLLFRPPGDGSASFPSLELKLGRKIVALGAPVSSFLPALARRLGTEVMIPPYAEVGSAVGAAIASYWQSFEIWIEPLEAGGAGGYSVHLPGQKASFRRLEEAKAFARRQGVELARREAKRAGAGKVEVRVEERDRFGTVAEGMGGRIYLDSVITISAFGGPALGQEGD